MAAGDKRTLLWEVWFGASLEDAILIKTTPNFVEAHKLYKERSKFTYVYRVEKWLWMEPKNEGKPNT
jgi:hypothetical protein